MFPRTRTSLVRGGGFALRAFALVCGFCVRQLLEALFPTRCAFCQREYGDAAPICERCRTTFPFAEGDTCFACFRNPSLIPWSLCCSCWRARTLKRVVFVSWYRDRTVRRLLAQLKYASCASHAKAFASLLHRRYPASDAAHVIRTLVVPVPLSPRRERWRGYNQAALIGRAFAALRGYGYANVLVRVQRAPLQSSLGRLRRFENAQGLFSVCHGGSMLMDRYARMIIVDDIATTGATLEECARIIRRGGFRGVIEGCVVAIEPPAFFDSNAVLNTMHGEGEMAVKR